MTSRTRNHPQPTRRTLLRGAVVAALAATTAGVSAAQAAAWPTEFPLPDGFIPEGITIGRRPYAYMGSRANGAVYRTDLRTGKGRVIHKGTTGTVAVGLKLDENGLLYISGGGGGTARIVDSHTGELVTTYQLTGATGHFINDVILLGDRAWFTDSSDAVLYGIPRGRVGTVRRLRLGGDWVQTPNVYNANGVVGTPDGRGLIVVSSSPGRLYHVDLASGHATEIALIDAADVANGDGLLRIGRTLYVVQNRLNLISVFDLDTRARTATLRRTITDPRFDVPTTVARWADRLYLVNARFTSPQTPQTTFNTVAVPLYLATN
ncbi:superoxide dismutase [Streptomyces sp. NBS 14/10]|uniref:SMP-30/gluconolactonase/LRE family protein n=1 Tax=Streptomyces sp. NBS 14/10 TaxID=1945643 RepID=UPI000B7E9653|nr:superoxide dismutase [Streptomyces sp. NBS 14/10]KAK1180620.1 superoxide dismutase [Streptomyces sp. NBS 14/10]